MFDSQQQQLHPTAHQFTVQLEQSQPHPSSDAVQESPIYDQPVHASQERPRSFKNRQQPHPHDQQQPRPSDQQKHSRHGKQCTMV